MECMICLQKKETKYFNIFIIGSEGLDICHDCEMKMVRYLQAERHKATVEKLDYIRRLKCNKLNQLEPKH